MKQTNNAIKFLMAQYRAIFKNANIAMVAAMASAALAAGSASAAVNDGTLDLGANAGSSVKSDVISSAVEVKNSAGGYINNLTIDNGGTLTFDGSDANSGNTGHILVSSSLNINAGGKLVLKGSAEGQTAAWGVVGTHSGSQASPDFTDADSTLNVNGGTLEITKSQIQMTNINLTDATVSIGGNIGDNSKTDFGDNALMNAEDANTEGRGSFTVAGKSNITMKDGSILNARTFNLNDGTIKMQGTSADSKSAVIRAYGDNGVLNLDGAAIEATGKGNFIGGQQLNLNSGTISIADSGSVTLSGKLDKEKTLSDAVGAVTASVKDITVTGKGTLIIGSAASGGAVTVKGNTSIDSALENNSDLTVTGAGVLSVGSGSLADNKGLFHSGANATKSGTVTLAQGGTLKINDTTSSASFDVSGLTFADTAAGNTIAIGSSDSGNIAGDFLTVSQSIKGAGNLTVKATNLTLGKAEATLSDKLGVKALEAENVTFINKDADFNLLEDLTLSTAGTGTINGGLKIGKTGSGATVTISGGSYTFESGKNLETDATGKLVIDKASKLDASGVANLKLAAKDTNTATVQLKGGSTLVLDQTDVFKKGTTDNSIELTSGDSAVKQNAISTDATSVLEFKLSDAFKGSGDKFTMTKEQVNNVKGALSTSGLTGVISFGNNFVLSGLSGDVAIKDVIAGADVYNGHGVTTTDGNVNVSVVAGNIQVKDDAKNVTIADDKSVILYNAKNGNFVANNNGTADVALSGTASLTLAGSGSIGAIDGGAANNGSVVIGHSKKETSAVVAESIGATKAVKSVDLQGESTLTLTKENAKLQTQVLNVGDYASLVAEKQDIVVSSDGGSGSTILGNVTAKSVEFKDNGTATDYVVAGGALLDVDSLVLSSSGSLFVGKDGTGTSAGHLEVGTLALNGGNLIVDPEWNADASVAHIKSMGGSGGSGDAIQLDGKLGVGKNSVLGFGFDSAQDVKDLFTTYGYMTADGKKLNQAKIQAALVLNKPLEIAADQGVMIDPAKTGNALETAVSDTSFKNKFEFGANTGLVITDGAYKIDQDGKKTGSAVSFATTGGNVSGDGQVVLAGYFTGADKDITIFSGSTLNGTGTVDLVSLNGLITAKVELSTGKIQDGSWTFDKDNKLDTYYTSASKPVSDLLKDVMSGTIKGNTIGYKFLGNVANSDDKSGVLADAAAHAATYAGAQQAAVASVTTMADAMFGRVGAVGVEAASISATGSQANGGVWLTPMYKSVDADGFNAEGASYGSEVDLGGVAFGADTVNGNMRFGAVFNIGSGDAEGKGNGNGLKDEFDYYGFGIYTAMGFGNFALVGDASMTVISHDVEGHGLKGKADTTAVTMGVTGQYSIATPVVDVTPHLGARFIRLNTDSYDLMSADGVLATTDFDVQNVFSVPLGVTLSKGFVAGGWTLAPSADLTVAFNTGDTEAKSKTTFTGVPSIDLTTEVLDEVTYGVSLGLGAQYGTFGTSFGINYTGSSNTDSFGVNAQARYMF